MFILIGIEFFKNRRKLFFTQFSRSFQPFCSFDRQHSLLRSRTLDLSAAELIGSFHLHTTSQLSGF